MTRALEWNELNREAADAARMLAADAGSRWATATPGTAMSLAPVAYLLFQRYLRHEPADPSWLGRDRFVLSAGTRAPLCFGVNNALGLPSTDGNVQAARDHTAGDMRVPSDPVAELVSHAHEVVRAAGAESC
jgi:transketolase